MTNRPTHVVLRIITGAEGGDIYGGTPEEPAFVEASEWPNTPFFEQSGHLRRVTDEDLALWDRREAEAQLAAARKAEEQYLASLRAAADAGDQAAMAELAKIEDARLAAEKAAEAERLAAEQAAADEADRQKVALLKAAAKAGDQAARDELTRRKEAAKK